MEEKVYLSIDLIIINFKEDVDKNIYENLDNATKCLEDGDYLQRIIIIFKKKNLFPNNPDEFSKSRNI